MYKKLDKRNIKGNSTAQYTIIIVLIALALVPVFFIFGNLIVNNFTSFYNSLKDSNNSQSLQNTPGSLGGTVNKPVKKCTNNECTIDFGDYILTGIPDNFNDYVDAQGSAGGTDKLAVLLNQLADQLDKSGKTDQANSLRDLSNLAAFIAMEQKKMEDLAKSCTGNPKGSTCMNNATTLSIKAPSNVSKLLPKYTSSAFAISQVDNFNNIYPYISSFGPMNNDPQAIPSAALVKKYQEIMKDKNMPSSAKGIAEEIYYNISIIGQEMSNQYQRITFESTFNLNTTTYDPLTSKTLSKDSRKSATPDSLLDLSPKVSSGLTDKLICSSVAGKTNTCH